MRCCYIGACAVQVGEDPDNPNGQALPVPPECTYTTADAPAADVAAHSAAALALSSIFLGSQGVDTEASLESARAMYDYAKDKAPLTLAGSEANATDAGTPPNLGVRPPHTYHQPLVLYGCVDATSSLPRRPSCSRSLTMCLKRMLHSSSMYGVR